MIQASRCANVAKLPASVGRRHALNVGHARWSNVTCRAGPEVAPSSKVSAETDVIPEGCARYQVQLSRPLGIVLETKGSQIYVAEVQKGGLAERDGNIQEGDILISTSGITYSKEADYGGATVRMGEARVTLNCTNESFDTVMAAIGTHKAGQTVEMTFQRC